MVLEVCVLGPLEVRANGVALALGTRKQQTLLSMLAVQSGQVVTLNQLIDELWPSDPPVSAVANTRTYAARLRRLFDTVEPARGLLHRYGDGYFLRTDVSNVDLHRFLADSRRGREMGAEGSSAKSADLLTSALAHWRGPMLAGVPLGPVLSARRAAIEEERLAVLEDLAELRLKLGQPAEAARLMRDHVRIYPLRERAQALFMRALAESGDTVGALSAYTMARRTLADELGIEPGVELQRLHRAVLSRETVEPTIQPATDVPDVPDAPTNWLPRPIADFTGRTELMTRILAWARQAGNVPKIQVIDGMAGSGKTTLVVDIAHRLIGCYPDGQLFVDLQGHGKGKPLEPSTALLTLLRQLGVVAGRIPPDLESRVALWQAELAERRAIVVLDNAASSDQVSLLLPVTNRSLTLVTSRRRLAGLDGVRFEALAVMSAEDAIELLAKTVGPDRVEAEMEAAEDVARRCGYLPLAIRLAGARLAHRPAWQVADLDRRLQLQDTVLPELAVETRTVVGAFASSYDPLSEPAKRMFRLLGLWPGQVFGTAVASALSGMSLPATESVIADLVDRHLVEEPQAGRFRLHDLMHQYASALVQSTETAAERLAAFGEVLDHYVQNAIAITDSLESTSVRSSMELPEPSRPDLLTKGPGDLEWLEMERPNLRALVRRAGELGLSKPAWQLARATWRFHFIRGYNDDILDTHKHGLEAARGAGDLAGVATMHNYIASAYHRVGDHQAAISHLEAAVKIHKSNGEESTASIGYANLGVIYMCLGKFEDAVQAFHGLRLASRGSALYEHALPNLGLALTFLGRYEEALRVHRIHLSVGRARGDHFHIAQALGHLGAVRSRLGQPTEAIRFINTSLALRRRTGNRYAESEAINDLAVAHRQLGRLVDAERLHRMALEVALASNERFVESAVLNDLGLTLYASGRVNGALDAHRQGLALATRLSYPFEQARALAGIASCIEQEDPLEARRHLERALVLHRKMKVPEQRDVERRLARWPTPAN